jgi:predicted transcriptional regulator
MPSSLDDVEFLARSAHRVEVLDAIHQTPRSRDELKALDDASRTTLSRTLAAFEDLGWVSRTNGRYETTPEGTFVATELTRLLGNLETAETLDGALGWLPIDRFDFDLRRLRDAEVVTLGWNDPVSMRLLAERLQGASDVRSVAPGSISREVTEMLRELTVDQGGTYTGILAGDAVETIQGHPAIRAQVEEMLETGRAEFFQYVGDEPLAMVMTIDDQMAICNHHSGGPQMEAVITDDPAVHGWALSYVDAVRVDADRLDADALVT